MAPPRVIKPGFLQKQVNAIFRQKKKTGDTSQSQNQVEEEQPVVDQSIPNQNVDTSADTESSDNPVEDVHTNVHTDSSASSQRRRGSNKNFELSRLTANGEKVRVVFDPVSKKPCSETGHLWSRHLGAIVRENNIIPHCTHKWRHLTPTTLTNVWQSIIDKFDAEDIEDYRDATMKQMKIRWEDWRYKINAKHIRPHNGNLQAIREHRPKEMTAEDWEWLLQNHYLTESFQKRSTTSTENKKKLKYVHRSGSKSFPQLQHEMESEGAAMRFEDFFLATRTRKDNFVDPQVQEKVAELKKMRSEHPHISDIDMIEGVFGPQDKGKVLGMGSISAFDVRGPAQTKKELRQASFTMQRRIDDVEERIRQEHEQRMQEQEQRRLEKEERRQMKELRRQAQEQRDHQMIMMMSQMTGGGGPAFTPELMAQLFPNFGQSSGQGSSSQIPPPVQPQEQDDEEDSEEED